MSPAVGGGGREPYLENRGLYEAAIVPLDRALVSSL